MTKPQIRKIKLQKTLVMLALAGSALLCHSCSRPTAVVPSVTPLRTLILEQPPNVAWLDAVGLYHNALMHQMGMYMDSTWKDSTWARYEQGMKAAMLQFEQDSIGLPSSDLTAIGVAIDNTANLLWSNGSPFGNDSTAWEHVIDSCVARSCMDSVEAGLSKRCISALLASKSIAEAQDSINSLIALRTSAGYSDTNGYGSATVLGIAKYSALFFSGCPYVRRRMTGKRQIPEFVAVAAGVAVAADVIGGVVGFFSGILGSGGTNPNGSPSNSTLRQAATGAGQGTGGAIGVAAGSLGGGGVPGGIAGGAVGEGLGGALGGQIFDWFTGG